MKSRFAIPLALSLVLLLAVGTVWGQTVVFPGNSLSGSFGAWGGTGYFYTPTFNVNAPGGIDITYYDIDVSLFTEGNIWSLKGVASAGVSKQNTMTSVEPQNNSVWCNILNIEVASGEDWQGNAVSTLGLDGTVRTNDDTRHQGTQDWYRKTTGGQVEGMAAGPYYKSESYVIPNPRFAAPSKTASELNSYDFRLRILPTGANSYTYEMWFRMHNSAATFEGADWIYNKAMNNSADAWRAFAHSDGSGTTVFPISNIDLSSVYVFMGLGNFLDPALQSLTWGRIEVTGTPTSSHSLSSYTILGLKDVKLGEENIVTGSVGNTAAGKKVSIRENSRVDGLVNASVIALSELVVVTGGQFNSPAEVELPVMQYNIASVPEEDFAVPDSATETVSSNYHNLTIGKNATVTVSGTIYGKIVVKEGAVVTFTAPVIDINNLDADAGKANSGKYTTMNFSGATVRVKDKVAIGDRNRVNGSNTTFYMGDLTASAEKFTVKGNDTKVTANVYMPHGKLDVHSKEGLCIMTGKYIAEEIKSGNAVTWIGYDPVPDLALSYGAGGPEVAPKLETQTAFEAKSVHEIPTAFLLGQNYPNPFNPATTIQFALPTASFTTLNIFNIFGQEVAALVNGVKNAGTHTVRWNAAHLPSGVYFYRLQAGSFSETKKLILQK